MKKDDVKRVMWKTYYAIHKRSRKAALDKKVAVLSIEDDAKRNDAWYALMPSSNIKAP